MSIASPTLQGFKYDTAQREILIGQTLWKIEGLKSFEDTVDQLYDTLSNLGNPPWLEDLCPYFAQVWPSGLALAEILASDRRFQMSAEKPLSVLELGAGLGLPSLVLASRGHRVTVTDSHPDVPFFLKRNMELNHITRNIEYVHLAWDKASQPIGKFDWVIGSDILYDRSHPDALCDALFQQLGDQTKVMIADPGRPYLQPFIDAVKKRISREPSVEIHRLQSNQDIFTVEFQK